MTDGYGGAAENRVRLPLEVFAAVRGRVGTDFAVGCRFLAEECIDGGSDVDDAVTFGVAFARAGMDFLSTSRGGKFDDAKQPGVGSAAYPYTGRSGYECMPQFISDARGPFGRNVAADGGDPAGGARRRQRRRPSSCTGGIHNFEMAEDLLARGRCDIVGAARQSLADPDWFRKSGSAMAAMFVCASSPITAKASTRSTSRSPASSGTKCRPRPASRAPPTANAA